MTVESSEDPVNVGDLVEFTGLQSAPEPGTLDEDEPRFRSGQEYINFLERENEIDMNQDGRGREKLIGCLKKMIHKNKDLKNPNVAGFRSMLKFLEDGKNFTKRLENLLIENKATVY
jgi:hypothetical protein